ncbi:MAG: pyridoxal-phosphate dependent enzyme family protein, partial [uncultured Rubrobacteraceae bacterium]
ERGGGRGWRRPRRDRAGGRADRGAGPGDAGGPGGRRGVRGRRGPDAEARAPPAFGIVQGQGCLQPVALGSGRAVWGRGGFGWQPRGGRRLRR